jgi:enoyl-CoA hydratase
VIESTTKDGVAVLAMRHGKANALELLRLRAGDAQARPLALNGATFGAGEALARGLVDEAVPATELAGRSLAAAQRLAALGPAFSLTKRQLRQRFLARVHDLAVLDAEVDAPPGGVLVP